MPATLHLRIDRQATYKFTADQLYYRLPSLLRLSSLSVAVSFLKKRVSIVS